MLLQSAPGESGGPKPGDDSRSMQQQQLEQQQKHQKLDYDGTKTHMLDYAPAPGWTVHVTNEGRLYYCK